MTMKKYGSLDKESKESKFLASCPKLLFSKRPWSLKMPSTCIIQGKHLPCKTQFLVCRCGSCGKEN
jgi:hypothetical protein